MSELHAKDVATSSRFGTAKKFLRFMPRRAVLHRYPLIGRFAHRIRTKSYLWSFRRKDTRKAYYLGSIISLMPLMGVQLPVGLGAALLFRTNFMVVGALQFLTNPITAAPIYYGTYKLGDKVLAMFDSQRHRHPEPNDRELADAGTLATEELLEPLAAEPTPPKTKWTHRAAGVLDALLLGGLLSGLALGLVLDVVDLLVRRKTAAHRKPTPAS